MSTQINAAAPLDDADAQADLRKAYRSSEWRILPLLFGLWLLAWVDRANVAFAKLQMLPDLGFTETAYGFGAGLFFLGYVVLGVPSAMVQRRVGARLTISVIALGWGATSVAMMFVKSTTMFYALRFLLGAFEAGFYPGVILYLNQWYPTQRRTRNFSIFHSAAICSTVAVGLTGGFVLDHMSGLLGVAGWRWMFLVQAVPTMVLAWVAFATLPDGPATARWLSERQRGLILVDLARDARQSAAPVGKPASLLANPMTWVLGAIYFGILSANSALSFFVPTILHEGGFGGYSAIGGVIAAICLLGAIGNIAFSTAASRFRDSRLACAIASVISVSCILVLPAVWHGDRPATFVTLALALAGTGAGISLFWQIPMRYMDKQSASLGVPLISSVANVAGFVTPWLIGYVRDLSGTYSSGFITAAGVQGLAAAILVAGIPLVLRYHAGEAPRSRHA
ncbi:Putative metabolite transport protein NicT [Cupriavidus yeoncheonensis]|uniref:Metabolite transport protein NicT n=1 Tax=Cupriavidus yeoncheonensis TaxID=1462994 RepID=A0A916IYD3_9BURK|nr:MFS transporter [Cupriavidus yeoncheonensis]CAG2150813.1 Putative metabolite transport protein NicT [Cupriavidus yeoncheonensis]